MLPEIGEDIECFFLTDVKTLGLSNRPDTAILMLTFGHVEIFASIPVSGLKVLGRQLEADGIYLTEQMH